jgi:Na+/H+ antiporter NhaD/arsenite permease-like protein
MNIPAIIVILILFFILMFFFSQSRFDYFPIALIVGAIAVVTMINFFDIEREEVIGFINFSTLIFIFAMQIIIYFATSDKVLEYVVIKLIHITKGNNRLFFYMICVSTGTLVAFIEDLTLSLILVPLIYRTCRILKIPAGTYLMGMTITINIGAILTPVSSLKNMIIGQEFGWGFWEYFSNMGILFLIALILTVVLIDWFMIRKEKKPDEKNKQLLLETVKPGIVIENKKNFIMTSVILLTTFVLMFLGLDIAFVSIISAAVLLITHMNQFDFTDIKKEISMKIIITFGILFILSNSLAEFGLSAKLSAGILELINGNIYIAVLITLVITSFLSAFLAGTPVTIILLPIFAEIANISVFPYPNPIIIAFIAGVNMAGNFLPQGSACDLLTLSLAKKFKVVNLDYKRLLKNGAMFATLHFIIVLVYTMIYASILY